MSLTVAAAAYPIGRPGCWDDYAESLAAWVGEAADRGAELLVFPEYGAMELAALSGTDDLHQQLDAVSELAPAVDALHRDLAAARGVHILAASLPVRRDDGSAVNRARLFAPSGVAGLQDKQIMTRWERDVWGVSGAAPLTVFDTAIGRIGILICYDAEFPLLGRALVEAGAELLLVPSCTETLAGYWRVRIGAMARALEGQCYAVMSSTTGAAPWSPAVDANCGAGGVFGPPDRGFPATGVLAAGAIDQPGWTYAVLDLARVAAARADGGVLGVRHWPEQTERLGQPVARVTLP